MMKTNTVAHILYINWLQLRENVNKNAALNLYIGSWLLCIRVNGM
jgi:hypothetical protein